MTPNFKEPRLLELAKNYKVADYLAHRQTGDRDAIADLIHRRFSERYLKPLEGAPSANMSGFAMMAIACLMVEALQSFREGRENTRAKGAGLDCFQNFFDHYSAFSDLKRYADKFYYNIRCGILHQAETQGGWRIRRDAHGRLFDRHSKVINARMFLNETSRALKTYCNELRASRWEGNLWDNARTKLDAICANCGEVIPRFVRPQLPP